MKKIPLFVILFYKKTVSPVLVIIFGSTCRYRPTCSEYAYQVIERFGTIKGLVLAFRRFLSCNYLSKKQQYDPVPLK